MESTGSNDNLERFFTVTVVYPEPLNIWPYVALICGVLFCGYYYFNRNTVNRYVYAHFLYGYCFSRLIGLQLLYWLLCSLRFIFLKPAMAWYSLSDRSTYNAKANKKKKRRYNKR